MELQLITLQSIWQFTETFNWISIDCKKKKHSTVCKDFVMFCFNLQGVCYIMTLFGVVSPFTNVLLEDTINIILGRIYVKKEIVTNIFRCKMHKLLYWCMKHQHFTFDSKIYIQNNGVAMGSPLGPVLVNVFYSRTWNCFNSKSH